MGEQEGGFTSDPLPVFSAGGPCEQFWHGQICPLFDAALPAFPLLTIVSPTLHGALKDGLEEAVVACDKPEPWFRTQNNSISNQACNQRSYRSVAAILHLSAYHCTTLLKDKSAPTVRG